MGHSPGFDHLETGGREGRRRQPPLSYYTGYGGSLGFAGDLGTGIGKAEAGYKLLRFFVFIFEENFSKKFLKPCDKNPFLCVIELKGLQESE